MNDLVEQYECACEAFARLWEWRKTGDIEDIKSAAAALEKFLVIEEEQNERRYDYANR